MDSSSTDELPNESETQEYGRHSRGKAATNLISWSRISLQKRGQDFSLRKCDGKSKYKYNAGNITVRSGDCYREGSKNNVKQSFTKPNIGQMVMIPVMVLYLVMSILRNRVFVGCFPKLGGQMAKNLHKRRRSSWLIKRWIFFGIFQDWVQ